MALPLGTKQAMLVRMRQTAKQMLQLNQQLLVDLSEWSAGSFTEEIAQDDIDSVVPGLTLVDATNGITSMVAIAEAINALGPEHTVNLVRFKEP